MSSGVYGWALGMFAAGLVTGWGFPLRRRRREAVSGTETPEQSLARLSTRKRPAGMPTRGPSSGSGQAYGGPQRTEGVLIVPEHIVWR